VITIDISRYRKLSRHAALLTDLPQRREWVGWRVTISVSYYGINGDRPEDLRIRAADVDL